QQVADELAGGRLRSAQRLAAGLPAGEPLRERVAAVDAQVAALARRAGQELAQGRREQGATLLAQAASMARDDGELPARLAAISPPAPREAAARMDGDHVLITWKPSTAAVGRIQYRVMRGLDRAPSSPAEGTAVVTRTERSEVTDAEAPPGARLCYSVFAARGGDTWSAPATAPPAFFTPDVTDVSVQAADTSVTASWRPHRGTDGILVIRRQAEPPRGPDDGTPVEASLTGFTETGLRTGTEYYYRILACYRPPDGQRRYSAGVIARAVPEPVPRAITDLEISDPGDGVPVVVATWTPPPYGQVRLMRGDKPPPWPPGTRIGPEDLAGRHELPGVPRRGTEGRDRLDLRLPSGHHYLTALTVGRSTWVAGRTVEARLVEPVRELSADRMHDEVRLGWIWPEGATDVLISWPGGERSCSRRVYDDEGGAVITIGAAETTVEVRAIFPQRGGRLTAPAAGVRVPARGVAVTYRIRRGGRWRSRQRTIELAAERATRIPALVVVLSAGRYIPEDPSEGETIARAGPQDITPGQTAALPVEVPRRPGWLACFVDPGAAEAEGGGILLFPPPAEEMRIR
ncbi:MAG: fibronectin type III domain-containing protein, partial [Actinobacteria bacterium]|nr:fibronectin type III domain-containing protein [Actinomycetota bacterium]